MTSTATTATTTTPTSRFRVAALSLLVAVAGLLGLGVGSAAPASADTITRYATVCVNANSTLRAHSSVSAWWHNGTDWVIDASATPGTNGCATVPLRHNGYYFLQAYAYVRLPCAIYRYFARTGSFVKQNQAARFGVTLTPAYYDTIPVYC